MATINDLVIKPFLKLSNEEGLSLILSIRESRRQNKKPTFSKEKKKVSKLDAFLSSLANMSEQDRASFIASITDQGGQ